MNPKTKITLGLCVFLTVAPILGLFISSEKAGYFISNYVPYIHLSISQVGGLPFAESVGVLFGMFIMATGAVGNVIFRISKFSRTGGLHLLLYLTVFYCGLRALGSIALNMSRFSGQETNDKIFIVTGILFEFVWITVCILASNHLDNIKRGKINTAGNNV